jgi:hypothetical protein
LPTLEFKGIFLAVNLCKMLDRAIFRPRDRRFIAVINMIFTNIVDTENWFLFLRIRPKALIEAEICDRRARLRIPRELLVISMGNGLPASGGQFALADRETK